MAANTAQRLCHGDRRAFTSMCSSHASRLQGAKEKKYVLETTIFGEGPLSYDSENKDNNPTDWSGRSGNSRQCARHSLPKTRGQIHETILRQKSVHDKTYVQIRIHGANCLQVLRE